jgi:hypothetical protein
MTVRVRVKQRVAYVVAWALLPALLAAAAIVFAAVTIYNLVEEKRDR